MTDLLLEGVDIVVDVPGPASITMDPPTGGGLLVVPVAGIPASGGGGTVTSVNDVDPDGAGNVALTPADIGAATATQGAKADTAVQPGSLATVASTGAYSDLSGKPTLGTAASHATGDFDAAGAASAAQAAAIAASQPLDSDLTAIAALSTTTFGRSLLALADAAAGRTSLGLGTAATQPSTAFDASGAAAAAQAASQPLDSDLTSIAALSTTSYGRAVLTLANTAALMALLSAATTTAQGIVELATDAEAITGTDPDRAVTPHALAAAIANLSLGTASTHPASDFQSSDAELTAIAGLTSAADKLPYFTGSGTAALATLSSFIRTLLDDADAATARGTLGLGDSATHPASDFQSADSELSALAGLTSAADKVPYFTGSGTASLTTATSFSRTLLALADQASWAGQVAPGVFWPFPAPTGVYAGPSNSVSSGSATLNTSGQCSWVPFDVPITKTFDRIGVNVNTAVVGGTAPALRLGIYNDDGTYGKPGSLLLDAGTVTITATGKQEITISQQLTPGRYWLGALYTHSVAPGTSLAIFQLSNAIGLPGVLPTNNYRCFLSTGNAAGSMPSIGSAIASVTGGTTVFLRSA